MVIAVTGHQRLADPSAWGWVESAINVELDKLSSPLTIVSSLAVGADQLVACLFKRRGGKIHAVVPFADYERRFAPADASAFRRLLAQAVSVEILPPCATDEDAYLAAGRRVVDLAQLLIAVWDGRPAKGKGGTADVVAYAVRQHVAVVHVNPGTRTVSRRKPGNRKPGTVPNGR